MTEKKEDTTFPRTTRKPIRTQENANCNFGKQHKTQRVLFKKISNKISNNRRNEVNEEDEKEEKEKEEKAKAEDDEPR